MALTGGGSTAEKVVAEQLAKETATGLLARTGKFAKDYLTLNAQTGSMAGIATGGKYLEMVNEERNGYYTEDGKFIKPDYNAFQLIVAPAAFGYVEGVFEKSTGKVLERGRSFFKTAAKQATEDWKNFNVVATKNLLKQAGINIVGGQGEEQLSEQLTNFGQNTINKVLLGKEVSLFENTGTVFKDTAMLTTMLSGIPIIAGTAIRSFMSKTTAKQLDTNARQLASIMYRLDNETDLSEISIEALEQEKQKIESQSTALLQKTISNSNMGFAEWLSAGSYKSLSTQTIPQKGLQGFYLPDACKRRGVRDRRFFCALIPRASKGYRGYGFLDSQVAGKCIKNFEGSG
jgi:hypothetical protein